MKTLTLFQVPQQLILNPATNQLFSADGQHQGHISMPFRTTYTYGDEHHHPGHHGEVGGPHHMKVSLGPKSSPGGVKLVGMHSNSPRNSLPSAKL